jgi:N-acetyl-beta-hexosaminidase
MWSPIYLIFCLVLQILAIWPQPVSFSKGNSTLWIASSLNVTYNGESYTNVWGIPFHDISLSIQTEQVSHGQSSLSSTATSFDSHSLVKAAVSRTLGTLFKQNFVPWKLFPRNSDFEPEECDCEKPLIKSLAIIQIGNDNSSTFKPLAGQVDESYNLTLTTSGQATINAASYLGVLHALESFIQLFYQHSKGGVYTSIAPVTITDSPKFQHRGLNMDVSRNWYPVRDILRTIDAISWNKFNRLHLHMTDAQSWPMDIPAIPELSQKGAYQKGLSYSRKDIQEIQTYAIQRGVEVIIEFDMPGHTTSIAFSHPELIAVNDMQPYDGYCNEPPCGTLKLNSSAVYTFLDELFADVLPRVSPYSSYFHTGGDEVNIQDYLFDETVKSNDTKILQPLIQKLVNHTHSLIRAAGLSPIVWEEMATAGYPSAWNLTLGDDVVVQTWQGGNAIASVTASGHKVIAGDYNFWVS